MTIKFQYEIRNKVRRIKFGENTDKKKKKQTKS